LDAGGEEHRRKKKEYLKDLYPVRGKAARYSSIAEKFWGRGKERGEKPGSHAARCGGPEEESFYLPRAPAGGR